MATTTEQPATPHTLLIIILTAPGQRPERGALLKRTVVRAATQWLAAGVRLEVLVLDDEPARGWPLVCEALAGLAVERSSRSGGVDTVNYSCMVRYVAVPADAATGRVCLRLKRNLALELATEYGSDSVLFFDDDDWRSEDAAQVQMDALAAAGSDACSVQVQYVCELHSSVGETRGGTSTGVAPLESVRYFHTPDGGGIFSPTLGNPGTALLMRRVWVGDGGSDRGGGGLPPPPPPGFPKTPYEDVDL